MKETSFTETQGRRLKGSYALLGTVKMRQENFDGYSRIQKETTLRGSSPSTLKWQQGNPGRRDPANPRGRV